MQYIVKKKGYRIFPVIALALLALVVGIMNATAVHNEGLLELDGNTAFNGGCGFDIPPAGPGGNGCVDNGISTSSQATFDWEGVCEAGAGGLIKKKVSLPAGITQAACTQDFDVGATSDTSYHAGSDKDYQEIFNGTSADWECAPSSNPTNKADILNAYAVQATANEGGTAHQLLYFGAERDSENGSVFNGFWFLQNAVGVTCPGDFSGIHACGDVLVLFNYEAGGRIGRTAAYQWQPGLKGCDGIDQPPLLPAGGGGDDCPNPASAETHDPLCLIVDVAAGDCRVSSAGDDLCGRVNGTQTCTPKKAGDPPCSGPGSFSTPWEPRNAPDVLVSPTFSEAGIDLTGLHIALPCVSAIMAESRSSPSVTATLKDFTLAPSGAVCGSGARTEIHKTANDGTDIQGTAVEAGTVVHDHAFVTPSGAGGAATGTVTYTLFNNLTCTPGTGNVNVISTQTVTISPGIPPNTESTTQVPASNNYTTVAGTSISYQASVDLAAPYTDSTAACEPLQTVDAQIDLSPLTATNAVNSAHTITCTIQQDDGLPASMGDLDPDFGPAPDGTTCTLSLLNNTAGATFVGGVNTCTTTAGSCTVQINTSTAGSVDIHATTTFSIGGTSVTRATGTGGLNSADANKRYVDAQIDLSPLLATNAVNSAHTITCTIQQDDGLATGGDGFNGFTAAPNGTTCTLSLLNNTAGAAFVGGVNTCTTAAGICTVQINTSTAGSVDIHATTTFSVGGVSLTRATGTGGLNSADANKVYVDASIGITPQTGTNPIGTTHTLTATVKIDPGTGLVNAPDGTCVVFSLTNTLGATATFVAPNDGNSCGGTASNLDDCQTSSGTCTVTIQSNTVGHTEIRATTTVTVGGVSLTRDTDPATVPPSGPGGTDNADKDWTPLQPGLVTAQNLIPNDDATLSGGLNPTGTITFKLFDPSDATCSDTTVGTTGLVLEQTVTVNGTGTYSTTNTTFIARAEGTWRWLVTYNGDPNNGPATSACGVERFTITNS